MVQFKVESDTLVVTININGERSGFLECACGNRIDLKKGVLDDSRVKSAINAVGSTVSTLHRRREIVRKIRNGEVDLRTALRELINTQLEESPLIGMQELVEIKCPRCGSYLGLANVNVNMAEEFKFPKVMNEELIRLEMDPVLRGKIINNLNLRTVEAFNQWLNGEDLDEEDRDWIVKNRRRRVINEAYRLVRESTLTSVEAFLKYAS